MRTALLGVVLAVLLAWSACFRVSDVVYAQSLPATLTATWNPNAPSENIVSYKLTLDGGTPIVIPASACSATSCSQTFPVATWGAHTLALVATNINLSGPDATGTPQDGPPATTTFSLNQKPGAAAGIKVR